MEPRTLETFQEINMKRIIFPLAVVLASLSFGATAQNMKPGLWEVSSKMKTSSGEMERGMAEMQAQMAAMTPEQRKMMEGMMPKQGMAMGAGGPGAMNLKVCITKEMAERNEVGAQEGDCKTTYSPRAGNTMKYSFTCANPPSSGQGEVTFLGPEAYRSKMAMTTTHKGKAEKMDMEGQGKWLGAECGAVKPMVVKK